MKRTTIPVLIAIGFFATITLSQNPGHGEAPVIKETRDLRLLPPLRVTKSDASENFVVGDVKGTVKTRPGNLVKPEYPEEARRAGIEGTVRVRVSVNEEGAVTNAETIEGDPALRAA